MSALTEHRDYCRRMATAEHQPDCASPHCPHVAEFRWCPHLSCDLPFRAIRPDPACPGCITDDERALWTCLADEYDAYLAHDDEGLFA